jgi:hypothetical protein
MNPMERAPSARQTLPANAIPVLNLVVVCEEGGGECRASLLCEQAARLLDGHCLRVAFWSLSDLDDSDILSDAVQAAVEADVIAVAVDDREPVPVHLRVWIDLWLSRRGQCPGALVALIDPSGEAGDRLARARDYLDAVARRGGLDFFVRGRSQSGELPVTSSRFSMARRASATTQVLRDFAPQGCGQWSGWGINE